MNMDVELMAIELPQWWYVEWSPLGAFRAVKVEDAHYRNYQGMKECRAVGYEPIGLFPTFESALEHIRDLKRMRKEQRHEHDNAGAGVGDEAAGDGVADRPREYQDL